MNAAPEILDIEEAVTRWDEILDRTEAGETFVIFTDGVEKGGLEPISPAVPSHPLGESMV